MKTKSYTLFLIALIIACNSLHAQNTFPSSGAAGIGTTTPNASSLLEINSTTKGILIPRMTLVQRNAITTPATGLMIFQTNSTPGFYYYSGTAWVAVSTKGVNTSLSNLVATSINQSLLPNASGTLKLGQRTLLWDTAYLRGVVFGNGTIQNTAFIPYTAGTGISISSNAITNSAPDKTVVLTAGTGISVSGTYPSFTITNTGTGTGTGWLLTGNAGTNSSTNFIGTTDAQSLVFKVNNTWAGILDNSTFNTGTRNTAFGIRSLFSNTTGIENTANGYGTLFSNVDGNNNSAFGKYALFTNDHGSYNTALGYNAMFFNTSGANNTAIGRTSLQNNVTGNENTASGGSALYANNSGTDNTATGFAALNANYSGSYNTATGGYALYANLSGVSNVANGYGALYNATGSYNTGTGSYTLYATLGNNNLANGYEALFANTTGNNNTALGFMSLFGNTTGNSNVAIGTSALANSSYGSNLVAIGDYALYNNATFADGSVSGIENTAVGSKALYSNTGGFDNSATGFEALKYNTNGDDNTANGSWALHFNNAGHHNTADGSSALENSTGNYNTAVGGGALFHKFDGNYNSALGYSADMFDSYSSSTVLGAYSLATASNQVRIGSIGSVSGNDPTSIGGKVGWSTLSDGRVKKNIQENVPGLIFINKLKPITYNVDNDAINKIIQRPAIKDRDGKTIQPSQQELSAAKKNEQIIHTGFIAQDVEKAAKSLNYDFSGVDAAKNSKDLYGLRYGEFVVPLVKAVQELSKMNDAKDAKIDTLQNQLNELKTLVLSIQQKQDACSPCSAVTNQTTTQSEIVLTDASSLQQNIPNPFTHSTTIGYNLPQKFTTAQIIITDKSGKTIKAVNVSGSGKGSLNVDASMLASGAYQYSLLVDGKLVATKQMVLGK